jgi:large subunit ribosomal protein L4
MTVQKSISYNALDIDGQASGDKETLTLSVLENSGNYLIYKDVLRHQTNLRQGTVSTKTRSEVRGGGRKPWRQKGTGRARAGSNRSPLWKGGGVIFGPKPRKFKYKLNKKERQIALQTLLYSRRNQILLVQNLEKDFTVPKTKEFINFCKNCNIQLNEKTLFVVSEKTPALLLASKNINNIELISVSHLNTLSILKAKQIVITTQTLNYMKEIYCA